MPKITLHLSGYLPPSQNQILGRHWSVIHREKKRAAMALRNALRSLSSSDAKSQETGTTIRLSNFCKIALLTLESCPRTLGILFKAKSSPRNVPTSKKKEPSS